MRNFHLYQATSRFAAVTCFKLEQSIIQLGATARQVTELEAASARMEAEANELTASRAPLETRRQQLVRYAGLHGRSMEDKTTVMASPSNAAA